MENFNNDATVPATTRSCVPYLDGKPYAVQKLGTRIVASL